MEREGKLYHVLNRNFQNNRVTASNNCLQEYSRFLIDKIISGE
jgi:hypothetical protein